MDKQEVNAGINIGGKTYTMGTSGIESQGIIQLVIDDIFRTIESNKS